MIAWLINLWSMFTGSLLLLLQFFCDYQCLFSIVVIWLWLTSHLQTKLFWGICGHSCYWFHLRISSSIKLCYAGMLFMEDLLFIDHMKHCSNHSNCNDYYSPMWLSGTPKICLACQLKAILLPCAQEREKKEERVWRTMLFYLTCYVTNSSYSPTVVYEEHSGTVNQGS